MSIYYYVRGFAPATEKFLKMKKVYDSCVEADIPTPDEVDEFFDGENPNNMSGIEINIKKYLKEITNEDGQLSYEVDIEKLPKSIKFIRFYVSD